MANLLLPAILGNLCAVLGHIVSWRLRKKHLTLLAVIGGLGFIVAMVIVDRHCAGMVNSYKQFMNTQECWTGLPEQLKVREAEARKIWQVVQAITAVTMIFALIEQFCISGAYSPVLKDVRKIERIAHWLKALCIVWGELFIGLSILVVSYKIFLPSNVGILYYGFAATWFVLTFLRPLCLRWARPFWQLLMELKPQKT